MIDMLFIIKIIRQFVINDRYVIYYKNNLIKNDFLIKLNRFKSHIKV